MKQKAIPCCPKNITTLAVGLCGPSSDPGLVASSDPDDSGSPFLVQSIHAAINHIGGILQKAVQTWQHRSEHIDV